MALNELDAAFEDAFGRKEIDPMSRAIEDQKREDVSRVKVAASAVVDVQPERKAEAMKIAARKNLPTAFVEDNFDAFAREQQETSVDYDKMVNDSPALAQWLGDPDNAALAKDDLDGVQKLSSSVKEFDMTEKMYRAITAGFAQTNTGLSQIPAFVYDVAAAPQNALMKAIGRDDLQVRAPDWLRNNPAAEFFQGEAQAFREGVPELESSVIDQISQGEFAAAGKSIALQVTANAPQSISLLVANAMGAGVPGLAIAGLSSGASKSAEGAAQGRDPLAATIDSAAAGTFEAAFEKLGTLSVVKKLEAGIVQRFGRDTWQQVLKDTGKQIFAGSIQEGAEEAATSVAQDLSGAATGGNPDLSLGSLAGNAANSFILGAASSGPMSTPFSGIGAYQRISEMNQAKRMMDFHTALGESALESKVRGRLPEAHQKLVETLTKDGPVQDVHMPVEAVETYFQSKGIDPLAAATKFEFGKEFAEAKETGGDIKISLGKFVAKLADTEHYQGLARDIKYSPEAMTMRETEASQKALKLELAAYDKAAAETDTTETTDDAGTPEEIRRKSALQVKADVKTQLLAMGNPMIGPKEAEQYALVHGQAMLSLASRSAMSPMEIYSRYGLKIQTQDGPIEIRPQDGEVMAAQDQVLNQGSQGNWKREGYTITTEPSSDPSIKRVVAKDKAGNIVGQAEFVPHESEPGVLMPNKDSFDADQTVRVDEKHRRKGIATAMYQQIERETGMKIANRSRTTRTANGNAFWSQYNRPFGSRELFQTNAAQSVLDRYPADPAPPTFSKLIQTVEQKMGRSADPQQIRAMLKDMKDEEKNWLGLEEFLAGKEKIKKHELVEFLRSNEPQIVDITKGSKTTLSAEEETRLDELEAKHDADGLIPKEHEELANLRDRASGESASDTKYAQYTIPGGENYREVLFTLRPAELQEFKLSTDDRDVSTWESSERGSFRQVSKAVIAENPEWLKEKKALAKLIKSENKDMKPKAIGQLIDQVMIVPSFTDGSITGASDKVNGAFKKAHALYSSIRSPYPSETLYKKDIAGERYLIVDTHTEDRGVYIAGEQRRNSDKKYDSLEEAMDGLEQFINGENQERRPDLYKSSHYDEKNILAHVRLDDRVDADGKKVLFVEEIQSDWHQAGRKKGYYGEVVDGDGKLSGVPNAPLKKTWHEYAMKRIVRMAAEGGYDRIAWTTGAQQADRFSLAQQVSNVIAKKNADGTFDVGAYKDGSVVSKESNLKESQLEAMLGKDLAKKIVAEQGDPMDEERGGGRVYEGDDLKVGGEGMKGFYDKILVDYANKLGKKFGAKVGETSFEVGNGSRVDSDGDIQLVEGGNTTVHSLDVTQQMKDVALGQGFELFQGSASDDSPNARIVIKPNRQMEIDLFRKNANLSSFLHETGHFYLEVMDDLAADPRTSQRLKDDYGLIRDWLGAKPGEKLTTEQHEKWARGFELYLARGQAPTKELRVAFSHFKVWLSNIYKNLLRLDVELNDEITGVMNRLLATDEQLAEAVRGQPSLFDNPVAQGLNAKEYAEYTKLQDEEKRAASEELTEKVVAYEMKKREAAYKEARKEVSAKIEAEANQMRTYKALSILQRGTMADGSPLPDGVKAIKIDRQSIVDSYGKEYLEKLPRPFVYAREGGVHFNMAAEMLGFESGDQLLKSIEGMPSKKEYIERETNREMDIRFPDRIMETFPQEAVKAAHADPRRKRLYFELQTLAKKDLPLLKGVIKKVVARVPREADVKAQAARMIGNKQVQEIRPYVFERAERKAAKEAGIALAKGDIAAAFEAKRRELLNYELFKAATEAQEMIEKSQEFIKKLKQKDEDLAKSRDIDLVNVARAIVASYGLGKADKTPQQYLDAMKTYDPENYDSAVAIVMNSGLVPGNYKEVSFNELSNMQETVKAIWDLSRQARQVEIDGFKMDREQIKAELVSRIDAIKAPGQRPGYDKAVTEWEKTKMKLLGMKASLRRVESWVSAVDGDGSGGVFRKYVWNPISDATAKYRIEKVKVLTQWQDVVKEWTKNADVSSVPIRAENLDYTFAGKAELLAAILHTGNQSNLEKLLVGRGWGAKLEDGSLDTTQWDAFILKMTRDGVLTKADYDFAQKTWDLLETLKPQAQKAHKAMYGFYFNEITAQEIATPFGTYRGGYVPAMVDQVMVEDGAIRQEQESVLKNNNSFMFPTTGRGFTKSRVEQYTAPLSMDLRMVGSHIDKVLRFIHIEPKVKEVGRLVMDKSFRSSLSELDPVIGSEMLVPWLQRAAQQTVSAPSKGWAGRGLDAFAKELRKRTGLQTMFFNVTNTLQQITGFTIAAVKVRPKYLRTAFTQYLKGPTDFAKMVTEKSAFMETRTATQVMEVNKIIEEISINPSKFDDFKSFVQQHGYFMQSAAQNMVDLTVWSGAYNQAVEQGLSEREAVRAADSAVRETQGSMTPEDMSRFEGGSPFVRLFTMFYGYFNMQANLLGTEFEKVSRDMGLKKGAGRLFYIYAMGFMLPAVISDLLVKAMGNGIDEDDDEQYLDDLLSTFFTSQFSTATAYFPAVGPIVKASVNVWNDRPYDDKLSTSPVVSTIEGAVKAPLSVYKAIVDGGSKKQAVRDSMTALGLLTGIPTGPIQRPLVYLADVEEGRADPTGPIDFTRGLITGKPGQLQ